MDGRILVACACSIWLLTSASRADEWSERRAPLDAEFAVKLAAITARCEELDLKHEAEITRTWIIPRTPGRIYLFLPEAKGPEPVGEPGSPTRFWFDHFMAARQAHAEKLFQLAQQAARERPDWAYQLAHEVLRENPQHEAARQALGYRQVEDRWVYAGDGIQSAIGTKAMPEYRWAARQYHRIDSANFRILTNANEETGREMAVRLEQLHCAWRQLFFDYWGTGALLARRFEQGAPDARARVEKHRVVWFQNRDEYIAALRDNEPLIEKTLGIYLDRHRTVFLYGEPEQALTTWLHEVTHQLFNEAGRAKRDVGSQGNIWVVEGVALFMESMWWHGDYCTMGGVDADRLQFARYRALNDDFYVPLAELTGIDREAMQNDARIGALYSQSAGLAHFFMTGEGGSLRPALVRYLTSLYQGRSGEQQLPQLTQAGFDELDRRYQAFLPVTDDALEGCYPVVNLYLGHSAITDLGLRKIPMQNVQWLDVGFTSISDSGLECLRTATQLKKLTLEHTRVTREALPHISSLRQLEYLDLSGLSLDDASLEHLSSLENLKSLWLTQTPITDEGLKHLLNLKNLTTLDVSGTQVTADGLARLRAALPNLEP